jgi:hypothetical protein
MSPRRFDSTEDPELRAKLDEAKRRLPLPKSPESPEPRECPGSPEFPASLVSPMHPMSNGQEPGKDLLAKKDLKGLAAHNACITRNTARKRRWQLLRDLRAVELRHGALDTTDLMLTFDEWYRLSQPFLDAAKTREDYLAAFLAEFGKVRVPTGEGQTITEALAYISRLIFRAAYDTRYAGSTGELAQNSRPSPAPVSPICEWDIFSDLPRCRESISRLGPSNGIQHQSRASTAWGS